MRKSLCSLALSGVLAVAGSAAFAQTDSPAQQPSAPAASAQSQSMKHRGMDPDKQLAEMTKKLSLSSDQQTQLKPILTDRQQQMAAIHQDKSASQQDKFAKMKSLRDDTNSKIEAVLNDTQKQKFEQMQAKRQQRWQQKQGGQTGVAPANSPS